eukprot:TRINITY_DN3168_c0_g1_i2.p1 TRINITY_DN3168_c0_g1~~TRINITY_DN3168_c0_g1_i2.p1  ORF type:complete len:210 (+),score=38.71 TRINITY_DN3168_c0_g1_i2:554-1183(+)
MKIDRALGIIRGELITAEEFSPNKVQTLINELHEQIPEAKEIVLQTRVDKSLISGFIIMTPHLKIDASHKSLINSAIVESVLQEEQKLQLLLSRAWNLPSKREPKPKPIQVKKTELSTNHEAGSVETKSSIYAKYQPITRHGETQQEYQSYKDLRRDPDAFLRNIRDQLDVFRHGKRLLIKEEVTDLEWNPDIVDTRLSPPDEPESRKS